MDYEKKYNESLERAKKVIKECGDNHGRIKMIEQIFPELVESDDERIRKMLIRIYKKADMGGEIFGEGITYKHVIAWLEKQGERDINRHQNHQDSGYPNGCIVFEDFNDGEGFYKLHLDYLNKKQIEEVEELVRTWNTESNSPNNENIRACIGMCLTDADEQRFKNHNTNLKECIAWLEKQGEQNPIDKVEPKFKVGDWILYSGDHCDGVRHITKINENGYYIERNGSPHGIIPFNHETFMRLWTIQDAKDGDVLVNGSSIFIFHFINGTRLMGYCHVNTDDERFYDDIGKNECFCLIDAVVNPATKEQCDLLFSNMKEAGYEWDAEKKEFSKFLLWLDDNYVIRRFTDGEPMTYGELIDNFKYMEQQ